MPLRDALLIEWIEAIPSRVGTSGLESVEARKDMLRRNGTVRPGLPCVGKYSLFATCLDS